MKYVSCVLMLALAAFVPLDCRQKPDQQQPEQSSASTESSGSDTPVVAERSQPDVDPTNPAEAVSDIKTPNPAEDEDGEPLLLLDDEEPLLLLDEEKPLLLLDEEESEELLLLDDAGEKSALAKKRMADNSRCHHCHLNYMDEDLAIVHARANIGCADCHGKCDEHIADESWADGGNGTPPEIMYPREKINPFCFTCHPKDKIDLSPHEKFLAGTSEEKYCTDCHGDHRLDERKCKWR